MIFAAIFLHGKREVDEVAKTLQFRSVAVVAGVEGVDVFPHFDTESGSELVVHAFEHLTEQPGLDFISVSQISSATQSRL